MKPPHHRRRIRAMRREEPETLIAARVAALRPFLGSTREQRLAALGRLLRRLATEIAPSSRSNADDNGTNRKEKGRHAKHSDLIIFSSDLRAGGG